MACFAQAMDDIDLRWILTRFLRGIANVKLKSIA
jgi:hypothetical protein